MADSSCRRWHVAGFVGLLVVTVLLRFPLLTTVPVGLHFDEAWSGIDAASVTWAHHPIFFTDSNGMEPLYLYLQTISVLLFGHTAFALRLVSAVLGTLTVPALYLLVRRIGGWRLGLFAAGILAVTYWHVHVSRLGYRAIALPLVECLAWWALWNGVHKRDWRWLAGGGAAVGLSLYTYSTARAFPLAVALWFGWLAIRRQDWRDLGRLVLVGAAALVIFSPLGWYFAQHPAEFFARVGQVVVLSPGVTHSSQPAVLVGVARTLGMFSFHGDPQWKYNLSGKPIFDPLMSVFFYIGIGWCLAVAFRRRAAPAPDRASPRLAALPPPPSAASLVPPPASPGEGQAVGTVLPGEAGILLLLWFVVMLVPGFVTTDPPETLHTLATVPAVCTFPALGAAWLWRRLRRRRPAWQGAGAPLAVALVLAEAVATAISYFLIWAPNPQTYYWLHGDVADLAAVLKQAPASTTLYVATQYYQHPTLRFLAPQAAARAVWFEAEKSLPVRATPGAAWYAFANGYQPLPAAASALPAADLALMPRDSAGGTKYHVYRLTDPARLPALAPPLQVPLGNDVVLLGANVQPPTTDDPQLARVTLRWRVLQRPQGNLSLFVHLLDNTGHRWAQSDGQGFFSADWQPGDDVVTTEDIALPVGTPAVPLLVSADFYDVATGDLLPWTSAGGPALAPDGGVTLGTVTALPSPMTPASAIPGARPAQDVGAGVRLLGQTLPTSPVQAGTSFDVTLYLEKTAAGAAFDAPVELAGTLATDSEPLPAAPLLAALPVGDVVAVRHVVAVSPRATATLAMVQLHLAGGALPLGPVRLAPLSRTYTSSAPHHPLAVQFGPVAELTGFDAALDGATRRLMVTLYWKALAPSDAAYTVFVHLVGPTGAIVAQHDGPPAAGQWPTTAWLANQVVIDKQVLMIPSGANLSRDALQVGLYDGQAPGQPRLPASGPAGQADGTYALLPLGE
jgi:4-amino-4-deoxy-L-arabinose transferase-like glycosyltransferase